MKSAFLPFLLPVAVLSVSCGSRSGQNDRQVQKPEVAFAEDSANKKIDVLVGGKLFTSYRWSDNVCKPILYPVLASSGTEITRGFPVDPREGERIDHPHQTGMWLTYGNVAGLDFWGNGSRGLGTRNDNGGVIRHLTTDEVSGGKGEGYLATTESWTDTLGTELLKEHSEYHFIARGDLRIIDRITILKAGDKKVAMPDTKEGMFGIRVARQLELPSKGEVILYSADGKSTKVPGLSNEGITGNYVSSEGIDGEAVWGTRARWMNLYGSIGEEKISLVICDHPENQSYPTYWHARGYGLFSANPLGVKDFTGGKEVLDFYIPAGQSVKFRYRVIINSGSHLTSGEIDVLADEFAGKYN